jgi:aspartate aminotransferase-like enzyme
LESQFHITIMGGQDQAKGKILRIGHMGYILPEQMTELMMKLGEVLHQADAKLCEPQKMRALETEMKAFWKKHAEASGG